jgi:hypothetical protein
MKRVCRCPAYRFPHRPLGGACEMRTEDDEWIEYQREILDDVYAAESREVRSMKYSIASAA